MDYYVTWLDDNWKLLMLRAFTSDDQSNGHKLVTNTWGALIIHYQTAEIDPWQDVKHMLHSIKWRMHLTKWLLVHYRIWTLAFKFFFRVYVAKEHAKLFLWSKSFDKTGNCSLTDYVCFRHIRRLDFVLLPFIRSPFLSSFTNYFPLPIGRHFGFGQWFSAESWEVIATWLNEQNLNLPPNSSLIKIN